MKSLHELQESALRRLFAVGMVLGPAMAEGLAEQGLSTARAEVIWRLHINGPMNQRQLSEALHCTPRNVTGLVDALEGQDLVTREPHPADRRATLVTLTQAGEQAATEWDRQARELASRLLDGFETSELSQLTSALDLILRRLGGPTDGASSESSMSALQVRPCSPG